MGYGLPYGLLDVYVVFACYRTARKHQTIAHKITAQKFDIAAIKNKINEINSNYRSSALHWNLKEARETLPALIRLAKKSYKDIGERLGVDFHSESGLDRLYLQFSNGVENFMHTSRIKAQDA